MTPDSDAASGLAKMLVTYRMTIYLGGIAILGIPLVLHSVAGVTVSTSVRAALTVSVVGLMVATYVAELRVDEDDNESAADNAIEGSGTKDTDATASTDSSTERAADVGGGYPLRTRASVALAAVGVAIGVYLGLERSILEGIVFVAGAYFFAYLAYEGDGENENGGVAQ
ncbi:MAG: hypothetical protein ABEH81_02955 [Halopenitus sp.]